MHLDARPLHEVLDALDRRALDRQDRSPSAADLEAQVRTLYAEEGKTLNEADLAEVLADYAQTHGLVPVASAPPRANRAALRRALAWRRRRAAVGKTLGEAGRSLAQGVSRILRWTVGAACLGALGALLIWGGSAVLQGQARDAAQRAAYQQDLTQRALVQVNTLALALKAAQPQPERLHDLTYNGALSLGSTSTLLQRRHADGRYRVQISPRMASCTALVRHFQLHPEDVATLHLAINDHALDSVGDLGQYACGYQGRSGPVPIDRVTLGPADALATP